MGGRWDFLPCISEQRVFGGKLWLTAGKRHRAAECSQAVTWNIRVTNVILFWVMLPPTWPLIEVVDSITTQERWNCQLFV